jgi:hypothetical protein
LFIDLLRICLGFTFLAAAWGKWRTSAGLDELLSELGLKRLRFRAFGQKAWLALEAALALALLTGWSLHATAGCVVVVCTGLAAIALRLRMSHYEGSCGCFGFDQGVPFGSMHVIRNFALLGAAIALFLGTEVSSSAAPFWRLPATTLIAAVFVCATVTAAFALIFMSAKLRSTLGS